MEQTTGHTKQGPFFALYVSTWKRWQAFHEDNGAPLPARASDRGDGDQVRRAAQPLAPVPEPRELRHAARRVRARGGVSELSPGLTWAPPITCPCGERHHLGARYYVSVIEDPGAGKKSDAVLALGPLLTHPEALARVDRVRAFVLDHYNPGGAAHWYGYGTVAMPATFDRPGKLNDQFDHDGVYLPNGEPDVNGRTDGGD